MEDNRKPLIKEFFSYIKYPNLYFELYEPGEKIIFLLRAHPFTQLKYIFHIAIIVFIIIIFNFIFKEYLSLYQLFIFNLFTIIFIFTYIWVIFLNWYFNVGIITNKKVVDIDFHGIIYKEITTTKLDNIEDITNKSSGYFGSLFNYGSIFIQTAGNKINIEFDNVPYPDEIIKKINHLLVKEK